MNEDAVKMWVQKAEDDLKAAKVLMRADEPITWIICFHAQQCVEKYLKAVLVYHGREYPRTHNIPALVNLCADLDPAFGVLKQWGLRTLTKYAASLRYGEDFYLPGPMEAQSAIDKAERLRDYVRGRLIEQGLVI